MAVKMNGSIRLAGFILTILLIIVYLATSWENTRARAEQVTVLKTEGCDTSKTNSTSIAVIENELTHIKKAQVDNTAAIIEAIKER